MRGTLKILLVEDHADTAMILAHLLRGEGHEVTVAGDVAAALKAAGEVWSFDLLISDIGLPDGTGCDLMRNLKTQGMQVQAMALSGYGVAEDVSGAWRRGSSYTSPSRLISRSFVRP